MEDFITRIESLPPKASLLQWTSHGCPLMCDNNAGTQYEARFLKEYYVCDETHAVDKVHDSVP